MEVIGILNPLAAKHDLLKRDPTRGSQKSELTASSDIFSVANLPCEAPTRQLQVFHPETRCTGRGKYLSKSHVPYRFIPLQMLMKYLQAGRSCLWKT